MLKFLKRKKAQSTLEYALLVVVVVGALLAINTYLKRGVQGKLKSSADDIGDQYDANQSVSYAKTVTQSSTQELANQNGSRSELTGDEHTISASWSSINMTTEPTWTNNQVSVNFEIPASKGKE